MSDRNMISSRNDIYNIDKNIPKMTFAFLYKYLIVPYYIAFIIRVTCFFILRIISMLVSHVRQECIFVLLSFSRHPSKENEASYL